MKLGRFLELKRKEMLDEETKRTKKKKKKDKLLGYGLHPHYDEKKDEIEKTNEKETPEEGEPTEGISNGQATASNQIPAPIVGNNGGSSGNGSNSVSGNGGSSSSGSSGI